MSVVMLGVMSSHLVDSLHDGSDTVFVDVLGFRWLREQLNFDITNDWDFDLLVTIRVGITNRCTSSSSELSILLDIFLQPGISGDLTTFTMEDSVRNCWGISGDSLS